MAWSAVRNEATSYASSASWVNATSGGTASALNNLQVLLIHVLSEAVSISSIGSSLGTSYTPIGSSPGSGKGVRIYAYAGLVVSLADRDYITVNFSGAVAGRIDVVEFTGGPTSILSDTTNSGAGTASTPSIALTGVAANALVVGAVTTNSVATDTGAGFTRISYGLTNDGGFYSQQEWMDQGTAGNRTVAFTGTSDWDMFAFSLKLAASGPNVTSVSTATPREGASLTITGTAFGASQGAGNSTINSVSQTETSWGDTSVVATVVLGTNKFGAAYNVIVTDDGGIPSNTYAGITGLLPANSGLSYVDIGTPNTTAAYRLTASADLASGDQVEYDNKGGEVTVATDGTFTAGPGVSSFSFRVWTSGSGYGPSATQLTALGGGATDRPIIRPFNKRSGLGF